VLSPGSKLGPNPKTRFGFERTCKTVLVALERVDRQIEHRHLHSTRDVHTNRIRNDRLSGGQHTTNGKPISLMRIRHQRTRHRNRQTACVLELVGRGRLQIGAPGAIWSWGRIGDF
jgi:hypothetical protein